MSVAIYDLPGGPMDLVTIDDTTGYLSLDTGSVVSYDLGETPSSSVALDEIVEDILHPRGLALNGGNLLVVELGDICAVAGVDCTPREAEGVPFDAEVEAQVLSSVTAQVVSYDLSPSEVGPGNVVLSGIPVASFAHAANGLTVGPDEQVYLAVGGVDWLWREPDRVDALPIANPDWLGTVLRLDLTGGPPAVVAKGLRNVYEVAFDRDGLMWAVDNNGPTLGGWRAEEILQIKMSADYGYPSDGTYGARSVRTDGPVWTSPYVGSAGVLATDAVGLGRGLVVGSCGQLAIFSEAPTPVDWEAGLGRWTARSLVDAAPGCFTSVSAPSPTRIVATLYQSADAGKLYVIDIDTAPGQ